MIAKLSAKEIVRLALEDAICWQQGLLHAYSHMADDPEVAVIKAQLAAYRKVLRARYTPRTDPFASAKMVSIYELRRTK